MLIPNMCHQNHNIFDFVAEKVTQNLKDFSNSRLNLLVTRKICEISLKTSNPKGMKEEIQKYIGLQSHHQITVGQLKFMIEMIQRKVFTQEIETLAWRTIHGHKWRQV